MLVMPFKIRQHYKLNSFSKQNKNVVIHQELNILQKKTSRAKVMRLIYIVYSTQLNRRLRTQVSDTSINITCVSASIVKVAFCQLFFNKRNDDDVRIINT